MSKTASVSQPAHTPTFAKIVATLGPASDSHEILLKMIHAGVSVFRLNFSHGSFDGHKQRLDRVRAAAREARRPIAVLGDLQGPKIRVGTVADGGIELNVGQDVLIVPGSSVASDDGEVVVLPTVYEQLTTEVEPGHRVLINDGAIRMLAVEQVEHNGTPALRCSVTVGGLVTTGKGINLPDSNISAPALTDKDLECVHWAVQHGVDLLALSFVRQAKEVIQLKKLLAGMCSIQGGAQSMDEGASIPVIAKIEKPQALEQIDDIVQAADGIMVARGDLGVEMDLARVPVEQKKLIEVAQSWGKPCIVATQMLETMTESPTPTRAEASDVANAIFDGTDAVMLSGETAVGKHPVLVIETMRRIIESAEHQIAQMPYTASPPSKAPVRSYRTAALAHGAWHVAKDLGARLIVCWSQRGGTARYLSQNGFGIPIIACSSDIKQNRRMALLRGVVPLYLKVPDPEPIDGEGEPTKLAIWNRIIDTELVKRGWAGTGDPVVLLAGEPLGVQGATNTLAIHYVGNTSTGYHMLRTHAEMGEPVNNHA